MAEENVEALTLRQRIERNRETGEGFDQGAARSSANAALARYDELKKVDTEGMDDAERREAELFKERFAGAAALAEAMFGGNEGVANFMRGMMDPTSELLKKEGEQK